MYFKKNPVTVIKKDYNSIPWAELYQVYKEAADTWEEMALATAQANSRSEFNNRIQALELSESQGESGAPEYQLSDKYQEKAAVVVNAAEGRRRAGQQAAQDNFIKRYNFGDWSDTILPQIITRLGNMHTTTNHNNLISGKKFVFDNFVTDADKGLWIFLMLDSRSSYLVTQYKGKPRQYSSLVPLILYAQKLIKGIPYSRWDPQELRLVVNAGLADAMLYKTDSWPTTAELLVGRTQGLLIQSGKDVGKTRNPVSTFKLYSTKGTCYEGLPPLVQVMLSQIWLAHPDNRTKYMVLDPRAWDSVPAQLVPTEVFEAPKAAPNYDSELDVPWAL